MSVAGDLGQDLMRFQGGVVVLQGIGCPACGNGFWVEHDQIPDAPACPHCGAALAMDEVRR